MILCCITLTLIPKENSTDFKISVEKKGKKDNFDIDNYLIGVIAAEMPASFEEEALKAQAVAARSYAVSLLNRGLELTDDELTQCFIDNDKMKEKWKENYEYYFNKIKNAVLSTEDLVMKSNNEVITAFYFAISNGYTQEAQVVFNESLDYIKSVNSSLDKNVKNYEMISEISIDKFLDKLKLSDRSIEVDYILYENTGHVKELSINKKVFSGIEFRQNLGLRSTDFELIIGNEYVSIKTQGYGHGVGMSQYGANELAKQGYKYDEILNYYYENIKIVKI